MYIHNMEDSDDLFKKRPKDYLLLIQEDQNINVNELSKKVDHKAAKLLFQKKFKKLKHHISFLNMEHDELSEIFRYAQKTFIKTMLEYCKRKNIKPPLENYKPKKNKNKSLTKEQSKELYREIAKQTHPDKTKDLCEEEIEFRAELYREATEGKLSGNFNKILKAAFELDIELQNIDYELIEIVESEIQKMENKISKMKNDIMYKWYYAEPDQQKQIFEQLTKKRD